MMSSLGALHLTKHTGAKQTATVIFFHGSGSNGKHMSEWVRLMIDNFSFPHIKVMFPTAPLQPYTPAGGHMSNVWFDRSLITPKVPDHEESLTRIKNEVKNLIRKENEAGIPTSRIIVGGFSMGGALALHTAYRWERNVAGVFAFGSFLSEKSNVYEELQNSTSNVAPLIQIHGDSDEMVDLMWGQSTFETLKNLKVNGEFHVMEKLGHSINKRGTKLIKDWIEKHVPEQ